MSFVAIFPFIFSFCLGLIPQSGAFSGNSVSACRTANHHGEIDIGFSCRSSQGVIWTRIEFNEATRGWRDGMTQKLWSDRAHGPLTLASARHYCYEELGHSRVPRSDEWRAAWSRGLGEVAGMEVARAYVTGDHYSVDDSQAVFVIPTWTQSAPRVFLLDLVRSIGASNSSGSEFRCVR